LNRADYAGAFIPGFVSALVERGCEVTVLTPDKAGAKEEPGDHRVVWFEWAGSSRPLVDLRLRSPGDLRSILSLLSQGERALRSLVEKGRIDECLALWAVPAGHLARRACRGRVPYSVWSLGSDIHDWARRPVVGSLVRRVLRGADRRFADGLELAAEVERISGRDCVFLPSMRRLPPPAPLPVPPGPGINFLFVGRLEPVKGADVLIDAFEAARSGGLDARLTLLGGGSLEHALKGRVTERGDADRVTFISGVPPEVVAAYMKACDCLVIPSRNESIPVVFSEAVQSGIPMLVSDVGDMGELARKHGLDGPVPPGDVAGLAAGLRSFAADTKGASVRFESARAGLLEIFDLGRSADRYLATAGVT
jgi:glycosyltransferase involved in cell wall biosynthesis